MVKKNYPSISLLLVAPPLAGPSLFQIIGASQSSHLVLSLLHLPPGRFARREVDIRRSGGSSLGWQSEHPRSKPNIVT